MIARTEYRRAYLALIHPRLFHSVIFIDPVMQIKHPDGPNAAMFSSLRREKWDSRVKAETQISKNPFFKSMDPRALKLFLAYALTDTGDGGVKLTTPKAQEAWSYLRSNFQSLSEDTEEGRQRERMLSPEVELFSHESQLRMIRPEMTLLWEMLPRLRPRALYIYGERSHINTPEGQKAQVSQTGGGRGGNGGVKDGGVIAKVLERCTHMCVFEAPQKIAQIASEWLETEMVRWKQEQEFWYTVDTGKSKNGQTELSDKWIAAVKEDRGVERPKTVKKAKL